MRLAIAAAALSASLIAGPTLAAEKPKLVVVISVDQFSADLFQEYRQSYTGGLARLSREGMVFPMGYQSHAATETCPGHSTILTGARPARTGIIANNWFDLSIAREDKRVYCSEDERIPGSTSSKYTVTTYHMKAPALGDLMKKADPKSRSAVVAGKDRAALMMGGFAPDERWWWDGTAYISDLKSPQPKAVADGSAALASALAKGRGPMDIPAACTARNRAVSVPNASSVGQGRFARDPDARAAALRASPDYDQAVMDTAANLRAEMKLGEGASTDLLILGLSATDYVGHTYGMQGAEMCIQLMALDAALERFFGRLDAAGIDYVVALTADHGGFDLPERQREHAITEADRADTALLPKNMGPKIAKILGLKRDPLVGEDAGGDVYVDVKLAPAVRSKVIAEAARAYRAHRQVAAVFTKAELIAAPAPKGPPDEWSLRERAKASFDPKRSGDLVVLLKPRIGYPLGGNVAGHGSPWDYDRRVPIVFWRKSMRGFEQPLPVETVDIMPTLAGLIGLTVDKATIDGRCLDLDEGPASTCPL